MATTGLTATSVYDTATLDAVAVNERTITTTLQEVVVRGNALRDRLQQLNDRINGPRPEAVADQKASEAVRDPLRLLANDVHGVVEDCHRLLMEAENGIG